LIPQQLKFNRFLFVFACTGLIFYLYGAISLANESTHYRSNPTNIVPAPNSAQKKFASPALAVEADQSFVPRARLQNACVTDFPTQAATIFLPLVVGEETARANQAAAGRAGAAYDSTVSKQAGALVPIGDQLGDVGQYYSQVAPSLVSTLHISNTSAVTQPFALTLYEDTGLPVRSLHNCAIPPRAAFSIHIQAGQIQLTDQQQTRALAAVCEVAQITEPPNTPLEPQLHGIYHAVIATNAQNPLQISIDTASDPQQQQILYQTRGHYKAIPDREALSTVHIPAVLATRSQENWWDTELIVQNVTAQPINLQFQLCNEQGHCFDNNLSTLQAYERRIFLASHLLYENSAGFLEERAGWFSATLTASAIGPTDNSPKVAVLSNIFKQPLPAGTTKQKAEAGSTCLLQTAATTPAHIVDFATAGVDPLVLRVYNPGAIPNAVQVRLVDGTGQTLKTLRKILPARGAAFWFAPDLFREFDAGLLPPTFSVQVQAQQAIVAFAWQAGELLPIAAPNNLDTIWYVPLIGAPNVEFRWDNDSDSDPARVGQPGSKFGLAETAAAAHVQRPAWARVLNWYTWSASRRLCNETVAATANYSTYIPMWWGLGSCGADNDRSCVNSPNRLRKIRNDIPSNCVGRPLFLANEPDLAGVQSFMTYHELGRMIYQFRSWPGELYSPVFAAFAYDAPFHVDEPTAWCKDAVKQGLCPGTPGCAACIQDGIVDGTADPHDISFKGLEDYFGAEGRWVRATSWPFEATIEGMLLHLYSLIEPFSSDSYWRARYLMQYRDRADQAGWPIIVNEYGFVVWPDGNDSGRNLNRCMIADHIDGVRQVLQKYLGNYTAEHGFNPKKIFWFHTGCDVSPGDPYAELCLFQAPAVLSSPVGVCWYQDAAGNSALDTQCNQSCSLPNLPFAQP